MTSTRCNPPSWFPSVPPSTAEEPADDPANAPYTAPPAYYAKPAVSRTAITRPKTTATLLNRTTGVAVPYMINANPSIAVRTVLSPSRAASPPARSLADAMRTIAAAKARNPSTRATTLSTDRMAEVKPKVVRAKTVKAKMRATTPSTDRIAKVKPKAKTAIPSTRDTFAVPKPRPKTKKKPKMRRILKGPPRKPNSGAKTNVATPSPSSSGTKGHKSANVNVHRRPNPNRSPAKKQPKFKRPVATIRNNNNTWRTQSVRLQNQLQQPAADPVYAAEFQETADRLSHSCRNIDQCLSDAIRRSRRELTQQPPTRQDIRFMRLVDKGYGKPSRPLVKNSSVLTVKLRDMNELTNTVDSDYEVMITLPPSSNKQTLEFVLAQYMAAGHNKVHPAASSLPSSSSDRSPASPSTIDGMLSRLRGTINNRRMAPTLSGSCVPRVHESYVATDTTTNTHTIMLIRDSTPIVLQSLLGPTSFDEPYIVTASPSIAQTIEYAFIDMCVCLWDAGVCATRISIHNIGVNRTVDMETQERLLTFCIHDLNLGESCGQYQSRDEWIRDAKTMLADSIHKYYTDNRVLDDPYSLVAQVLSRL